jgi:hypothetical protein
MTAPIRTVTVAPTRVAAAPTVAVNTPQPLVVCPGTPPSVMAVGIHGRVTFSDGTPTRLRASPGGEIVLAMPEGFEFNVVGGPQCQGEFTWWQLQVPDGRVGWSAEGDSQKYYIESWPAVDITVRILQVSDSVASMRVQSSPSASSMAIETLFPGDRMAWDGSLVEQEGVNWARVRLYDGRNGYVRFSGDLVRQVDPRTVTPGLFIGQSVQVLLPGDRANLRAASDTGANRLQQVRSGTRMTVIGGPAYADYFVWWQFELGDGTQGWIVDVPGWFQVVQ